MFSKQIKYIFLRIVKPFFDLVMLLYIHTHNSLLRSITRNLFTLFSIYHKLIHL